MRYELLRHFIFYLLFYLEEGDEYDTAQQKAKRVNTAKIRIGNINVDMHKSNPAFLIDYVIRTARNKSIAENIKNKWSAIRSKIA